MPDMRLKCLTITIAIARQPLFSTPSAISCRLPLPPFMPAVPTIHAACFHFSVPSLLRKHNFRSKDGTNGKK